MKYIIEHLEPELYEWCLIEYKNISKMVGKENIIFTNIKKEDIKKIEKYGKVHVSSLKELNLDNICILDPEAKEILTEKDNEFNYMVFGGILGDYPPKKRTELELTNFFPNAEKRNIGKEQFSTDNAVFITKEILKGKKLEDFHFESNIEIKINKIESTILPFKYPILNGKPNISKELISYLKNQ